MTRSYPVDVNKLKYAHMNEVSVIFGAINVPEDYENFDKVKKFLAIPEDSPLLHESVDERFDPIIEFTKLKFSALGNRIDSDFEALQRKQNWSYSQLKNYGSLPRFTIAKSPKISVSAVEPSNPIQGEMWFDSRGGTLNQYLCSGGDGGPFWKSAGDNPESKPSKFSRWLFKLLFGVNFPLTFT